VIDIEPKENIDYVIEPEKLIILCHGRILNEPNIASTRKVAMLGIAEDVQ
jgi:hypothetical protein